LEKVRRRTENGFNFFRFALFNERIEYNDMLALEMILIRSSKQHWQHYPGKTEEISIAVRTPFGSINFIQVLEREFELCGQIFNSGSQIPFCQW
jgi:hypothetical protein